MMSFQTVVYRCVYNVCVSICSPECGQHPSASIVRVASINPSVSVVRVAINPSASVVRVASINPSASVVRVARCLPQYMFFCNTTMDDPNRTLNQTATLLENLPV